MKPSVLPALVLVLAPSAPVWADEAWPGLAGTIYGGSPTAPGEHDEVVAIVAQSGATCTGTLVAPRVVLTAAHCIRDIPAGTLPDVYHGTSLVTTRRVAASSMGAHPKFCESCDEDVHDFGYVILASDIPLDFTPARPVVEQDDWDAIMQEGTALTLVGYGQSDDADPADPYLGAGTKREVTTRITRLSATHLELRADESGSGTCEGDSGGPAFAKAPDGTRRLAGVLSRGTCGSASFYAAPYPALCWLRDETGTDLLPDGCSGCDCLDTEGGCGCRVAGARTGATGALAPLILLAALATRRLPRRRHSSALTVSPG